VLATLQMATVPLDPRVRFLLVNLAGITQIVALVQQIQTVVGVPALPLLAVQRVYRPLVVSALVVSGTIAQLLGHHVEVLQIALLVRATVVAGVLSKMMHSGVAAWATPPTQLVLANITLVPSWTTALNCT